MIVFYIAVTGRYFTTDPERVPDSRNIEVGDYIRIPDGRIFFVKSLFPTKFVEVNEDDVPPGVNPLNAQYEDA